LDVTPNRTNTFRQEICGHILSGFSIEDLPRGG
jgi:hypothetical protein